MRTIFLLLFISLFMVDLSAQTNYYSQDKTFYEEGYTYQCDVTEGAGLVNLYNKDSKYIYVKLINRHTGEKKSREEEFLNEFEEETWTKPKCRSIVNNAFHTKNRYCTHIGHNCRIDIHPLSQDIHMHPDRKTCTPVFQFPLRQMNGWLRV